MDNKKDVFKNKELLLGLIMLVISVVYFIMTSRLPDKADQMLDSKTMPLLVAGFIFILGIMQTIKGLSDGDVGSLEKTDKTNLIKTVVLLVLYIVLFSKLGFIISSALFIFFQTILLTPPTEKKNYILFGVIAVFASVAAYLIFKEAFDIFLPQGILKFI